MADEALPSRAETANSTSRVDATTVPPPAGPAAGPRIDWFWRLVIACVLLFLMAGSSWIAYQMFVKKNAHAYSADTMDSALVCAGSLSSQMKIDLGLGARGATEAEPASGQASGDVGVDVATFVEVKIFDRLPPDKLLEGMKQFSDCMIAQRKLPKAALEPGRRKSNIVWNGYSPIYRNSPGLPVPLSFAEEANAARNLYENVNEDQLTQKERTSKHERIALMSIIATEAYLDAGDSVAIERAKKTATAGLKSAREAVELFRVNHMTQDFIDWKRDQPIEETLADRWLQTVAHALRLIPAQTSIKEADDALKMMSCPYVTANRIIDSRPLKRFEIKSSRLDECAKNQSGIAGGGVGPIK